MLLSYKPVHLQAQQRLEEEGCVVDSIHFADLASMVRKYCVMESALDELRFGKRTMEDPHARFSTCSNVGRRAVE